MAKFEFRLHTLLKIRESERDDRRLRLAEALDAERVLLQRINDLESELVELMEQTRVAVKPGPLDMERVLRTSRYEMLLEAQLRFMEQRSQQLREEIERRREALVEADRGVRVLEKLRDHRFAEFEQAERELEQRQMDELGLHRRQVR